MLTNAVVVEAALPAVVRLAVGGVAFLPRLDVGRDRALLRLALFSCNSNPEYL